MSPFSMRKPASRCWRTPQIVLLVALFLLVFANTAFWRYLLPLISPADLRGWMFVGATAAFVYAIFTILLTLLSFRLLLKPLLSFLLLGAAFAAYFMNQYGVMIDAHMMQNVFETNATEARDLFTWKMLPYVGLLGVLPAVVLWRARIVYSVWWREMLMRVGMLGGSAALIGLIALLFYQDFASLFRNHREVRYLLNPVNYLQATSGYFQDRAKVATAEIKPVGVDARKSPAWQRRSRKSLTVVVIGETARAENFSLNGYGRETNPELSKVPDLINFSNVHSCGTETAVSLPCIFSGLGRDGFSHEAASTQEGLLDVLRRAGFAVRWRENQSGCKGVCARVEQEDLSNSNDPHLCADHECHDEILLSGLQQYVDNLDRDAVLVLHQMGSHGPAYYKRYPAAFERFTPVCKTSQLDRCSREEIVNGFDNTILYTDFVLARIIEFLRANEQKVDSAMIYMSDHGESLGEFNIYLHGMPYALAPEQQKHVPTIFWFSPGFRQDFSLDTDCLRRHADVAYSHDNLFHSVLGLLGVETAVYSRELDMFAGCRMPQP